MANDNYVLTEEGKKKLEEELHYLENEKRAEIGERIKVAREFGDISENSEYDDAKNEQGMIEARIVDMNGRERVFTIVGGAESDAHEGKISNESPVGQALLGCKKGDEVTTTGPTGRDIKLTVIKIEH